MTNTLFLPSVIFPLYGVVTLNERCFSASTVSLNFFCTFFPLGSVWVVVVSMIIEFSFPRCTVLFPPGSITAPFWISVEAFTKNGLPFIIWRANFFFPKKLYHFFAFFRSRISCFPSVVNIPGCPCFLFLSLPEAMLESASIVMVAIVIIFFCFIISPFLLRSWND